MVKPRGIGNKNAFEQFVNSVSSSGTLRTREVLPDTFVFDVNAPVVQMQKNSALVVGAGRLVFGAGVLYIPAYTLGIGVTAGSGYTVPSDGIYQVDANVAVSGIAAEWFAGSITVDGVSASGTASFQPGDTIGAACVNVHGVVHAVAGQMINVGVRSRYQGMTSIGSEDLVHAPAANITVVKLPSDELSFNE